VLVREDKVVREEKAVHNEAALPGEANREGNPHRDPSPVAEGNVKAKNPERRDYEQRRENRGRREDNANRGERRNNSNRRSSSPYQARGERSDSRGDRNNEQRSDRNEQRAPRPFVEHEQKPRPSFDYAGETRAMTIIPRDEHNISRRDISENALKVLYRLNKSGYEAFLVGGGVRDLLLDKKPKDFDITTNATPDQVRKLFRNCRLVGRRFRLAHVMFGPEIIEVATFRGHHEQHEETEDKNVSQQAQNGMLLRDNIFGTIEDDAQRRDFTINSSTTLQLIWLYFVFFSV